MRFHRLALSAIGLLAVSTFSGNNGFALADEAKGSADDVGNYSIPENSETFAFQAEVNRMLDIVINSLYQNKDVFLRELISNASDALDKIRFLSIENPELLSEKEEMEVKIEYDDVAHTVTVTDSGIGMTHDDLVGNLGTVARSGTTKFLEALQDGADIGTIGMFGVGFYSSFLVAERVKVASKHPDDPVQHVWESVNGEDSFHVYDDPRGNSLGRGTEITLYLKEDAYDYATSSKLEDVASFYSEFISHPIHLKKTWTDMVPKEVPEEEDVNLDEDEEKKEEKDDDLELGDEEDVTDEEEEEEEKEPEMEEVRKEEWNQVNTKKPIWTREKDEITDEEYKSFFGAITRNEHAKPMYWTHFKAEGNINFKSIVYLPEEIPWELMQGRYDQMKKGVVKLYVRKVLISDEFPLLPTYLSWVKGVVDSDDLPLNVNRETLQESKIIRIIGKKMVRKILEMMKKLSQEPHPTMQVIKMKDKEEETEEAEIDADGNVVVKEESEEHEEEYEEVEDPNVDHPYISFYKKYHPSLKMGIIRDEANRNRLLKLLRFKSSKASGEKDWISLDDYVKNMKEWQEDIYYMSGMSQDEVESSQFMKKFKRRDVEVLYFIDPVDEIMMQHAKEYDGKQLKLISKEGTKLPAEDEDLEKRRAKVYEDKFKPLTKYIRKNLDVYEIKISQELEETPALISSSNWGQSATMERIQQAQAFYNTDRLYQNTRILQINPRHPIINKLLEKVTPPEDWEEDEDDPEEYNPGQDTLDLTKTLFDMALINSGFRIADIKTHSKRITRVLKNSMDLESLEVADEIEIEDDEEEEEGEDDIDGMDFGDGMPDFDAMDMDMDMGGDE
mmetsp:Transcript_53440/g.64419  ORF Transcript_53440/g.64419 Transcript_53440/m.64419 type:complete len:843 (-) Transcript_53440:174-2702(-)|eukprot:CAMPEP_0172482676 /NCGR_PEP_ID=MMETSP1066-20121228/9217_1 /TAXON_ID=671091 /ORGANISM="Coscinodiscus wailesii, Strain CCMP2513" /LENGTH=842 /DNA_ID=CAMNT_0013245987 /DNA_START=150 /DNA_END=2678 /DNA_ORIENTATION=+